MPNLKHSEHLQGNLCSFSNTFTKHMAKQCSNFNLWHGSLPKGDSTISFYLCQAPKDPFRGSVTYTMPIPYTVHGPSFFSPIWGCSLFLKLWCLISPFSIMSHFLWKSCLLVTSFWPSQVKYDLLAGLVNCHYTIGFDRLLSRRICFTCLCRINLTKEITHIFLYTDSWGP